ncbi:MAG: hypothetical protein HZA60_03650 [Deltaproteobacteria bacterium]|nr:hypothetical protein [Deltaproteobacteria bacterium]
MANTSGRKLLAEYCRRFGQIACERGYVTPEQVKAGLAEQVDDDLANRPHRLLGTIFFEKKWMTPKQIETVLHELFREPELPEPTKM